VLAEESKQMQGLEALFGSDMEVENYDMKHQAPTMKVLDDMLVKEKQQLKLIEKRHAESQGQQSKSGSTAKSKLSQRERETMVMEERLRTTMKAKVRSMVERIGEDERMMLKGERVEHKVSATSHEMTMPALGQPGGLPASLTGDADLDPDCAILFFHGLGHSHGDKKIEDVFFKTDAIRYQRPVNRLVKKCPEPGEKGYDVYCKPEMDYLGDADRCMILLPKAPVAKHTANGDLHTTSWFNQPMLGHGSDYLPPAHGVDFDEANRHSPKIHAILDDIIDNYGINPEMIFLSGFSQGATVAAMAALSYHKPLGGLAMFSGMLLGYDNLVKMNHNSNRDIPIVWSYGADDDVYLPSLHDEGVYLLTKSGYKISASKTPGLHYMTQRFFDTMESLVQHRLRYMDWVRHVETNHPESFETMVEPFSVYGIS